MTVVYLLYAVYVYVVFGKEKFTAHLERFLLLLVIA